MPSSIPAYLIRVVPELKVEGETVLTGDPMRLGEELAFSYTVNTPILGSRRHDNWVVAGSYLAVGVVGGAVAPGSLQGVQQNLEQTKAALESGNHTLFAGLTREDLLGDLFHAGLLGYFAQFQALGQLAAQAQGNHFQLAPSAGTYGYVPEVTYFFGVPRSIAAGGVEMDMDRIAFVTNTDDKEREQWRGINFQLGALSSALEHAVPEQMFVTDDTPGEAVSAIKALQKAVSQGQRIYHITPANQATALPNIRHNALTMSEIRSALASGREVIVHTDPISAPGWTGAGYVIFDPDTGAGAWKIAGGANGSYIALFLSVLLFVLMIVPQLMLYFSPVGILTFTIIVGVLTFSSMLDSLDGCNENIGIGLAIIASAISIFPARNAARLTDRIASILRVFITGIIATEGTKSAENSACQVATNS